MSAATPTFIAPKEGTQLLVPYLDILEDPHGTLSFDEILSGKAGPFLPLGAKATIGFSKAIYWVRLKIDWQNYQDSSWYLTKQYLPMGSWQLFYPSATGYQSLAIGENPPSALRAIKIRDWAFQVPTPRTASATYYMRFDPDGHSFDLHLSFSDSKTVIENIHTSETAVGLWFGALLAMWFYNGALYAYTRDKNYLYYIYYLGAMIAVFTHLMGFVSLWGTLPPLAMKIFPALAYVLLHGMTLFARRFLDLRTSTPRIDTYLKYSQIVLAAGAISTFFIDGGYAYRNAGFAVMAIMPALFVAGTTRALQGYYPARLYCIGWIVFIALTCLFILRANGLVPTNMVTYYGAEIGAVWEAIFFSLALGYRIKLVDREKKAELEALVADRTRSLQGALEARRLMVANASHELRTPVNSLRLLLTAGLIDGNGTGAFGARLRAIVDRMIQVVETLLLLDPDRSPPRAVSAMEVFNLGQEIEATANIVVPYQHSTETRFTLDLQDQGTIVRSDRTALTGIVTNLLTNAFKFTDHGTICLRLRVATIPNPGQVLCTIEVEDTGRGIAPPMHERIFEPFVTAGEPRGHTSTGLGLPYARRLAEDMGGRLTLERSAEHVGSLFRCVLPLTLGTAEEMVAAVPTSAETALGSALSRSRLRVLLAEDDPATADVVMMIMDRRKHDITHVTTAAELRHALTEHGNTFDAAFIDHRLPGATGLDVVREYRALQPKHAPRLFLVTADATPEVLAAAQDYFDDVVVKPTTAEVVQRLLDAVRQQRPIMVDAGLIDPKPFGDLRTIGATPANLGSIYDKFKQTSERLLGEIQDMLRETADPLRRETLLELIHQWSSGCKSVGARALVQELHALGTCEEAVALSQQLEKVVNTFAATCTDLETMLAADATGG